MKIIKTLSNQKKGRKNMKNYKEHHTSLTRGYVKVNQEVKEEYNGRFGKGYTVKRHNPNSTQYCYITYYVEV